VSIFDRRATECFTIVLESKYMRRRLTLNASVADSFDEVARGGPGASMDSGKLLEKVGHNLRMGQKGPELSSSRPR